MIKKENNFWNAVFLVFLIDQGTKLWAINFLDFEQETSINKFLSLRKIYNEDTIMMIFHNPMNMGKTIFILLWIFFCVMITISISWVTRQPSLNSGNWTEEFAKSGLFLILGAAWGNAFDRIFRIGVVDFIEIKIHDYLNPVINIADIMIYMGEFCLILAWINLGFCYLMNIYKTIYTINYNV